MRIFTLRRDFLDGACKKCQYLIKISIELKYVVASEFALHSKPENNAKTPLCWIASKFALKSKPGNDAKTPVYWIASKFALNSKPENNAKTPTKYSFQINLVFLPLMGNLPP